MAPPQVTLVTSALRDSDAGVIAPALRRDDGRVSTSRSAAELLSSLGIDVARAIDGASGDAGEVVELPVARTETAVAGCSWSGSATAGRPGCGGPVQRWRTWRVTWRTPPRT